MNRITGMIIGEKILEVMWECINILEDRIVEEDIQEIVRMKHIYRERGRSRSRERYSDNNRRDSSSSNSRSKSGSRASTNRDQIRCFKCREYDHFAKDCLTTKEERQSKFSRCLI